MQLNGSRKILIALFLVLSTVVVLFIVTNLYFLRATTRYYQQLYLNQQHLQLQLSAAAIQENIQSSLSETSILARYSLVEYEQGQRSDESIDRLLEVEQHTYSIAILYAYFRTPEKPEFLQILDGLKGEAARKFATQSIAEHWDNIRIQAGLGTSAPAYVFPLYADKNAQLASFAYPVTVEGSFQGVLFVSMDLGQFAERYLQPFASSKDCTYFITSSEGRIVWCPKMQRLNEQATNIFPFFPDPEEVPDGKSIESSAQGKQLITWSSVDFADAHFHLVMTVPEDSVTAIPTQIRVLQIGINALLLIIAGLALFYTLRLFRAQKQHSVQVEKENLLQKKVTEKTRQLEKAANRYSLLFENANDGIFILKDMKIIQCNNRATQLFNARREELLGKSPIDFSPELQAENISSIEKAKYYSRRCLSGIPQIFEWQHFDAHGTEFTAEVSLSAIKVGEETLFQSFIRDITARKTIEENLQHSIKEREIMLQEIHHRVKNNLQIIDSILSLQRSYAVENDRSRIIPQIRRRIAAMAEAHETMYRQQDFNTVNMAEFLQHLVSQIEGTFIGTHKRVQPQFQAIGLPLEKGLLVGFITSELVENAFLHTSPRDGRGVAIQVSLTIDPGNPHHAVLAVADNGDLPEGKEALKNPGLGIELVSALSDQLQGSIHWNTNTPGTGVHVSLSFPKDPA